MLGVVHGEEHESVGEIEYEEMTEKSQYGKKAKSLAKKFLRLCLLGELPLTSNSLSIMDDVEDKMCYMDDSTSLTTWRLSGLELLAVLAIIAVMVTMPYVVFKVYKTIRELMERTIKAEEEVRSVREEV